MLDITPSLLPRKAKSLYRKPRQERSKIRFEAILDAAAELLETMEPEDVSIYTLSEKADISPTSIYHFFPDANWAFVALAERYYEYFLKGLEQPITFEFNTWQDLQSARFEDAQAFFNENGAARRLLLGSGLSIDIRLRDLEIDRVLAQKTVDQWCHYFVMPEIPKLVDRITEMMIMSDALWSLSVHRWGYITDEMAEQAGRARIAYGRTFLPEYLPLRTKPELPVVKPQRE